VIPTIVVDVGNTRIKWGHCGCQPTVDEVVALQPDDPDAWERQLERWHSGTTGNWILAGVHPQRRDAFAQWLRQRGASVQVIDSYRQLPLAVKVDAPDKVGLDRLFNAVAANLRRPKRSAAVVVDAGSAVTVDVVDPQGAFRGGAIFPGVRLMAKALHDYTAQLPLVAIDRAEPPPGTSTAQAIRVGVLHALQGGVARLLAAYSSQYTDGMIVYLTGGDASLLADARPGFGEPCVAWPEMTLEGIRHSAGGAIAHG
jgi:type III pantothenate kinase